MQTVAVVGSGISGMGAAHLLSSRYRVTLYEKNSIIGGHSRTITVKHGHRVIPVDTGFIVFNHATYPELVGLFNHLGVVTEKSNMSFALTSMSGSYEWAARSLNAVFSQRRNLLSPSFYKMILDVMRFFKHGLSYAEKHPHLTLNELIDSMHLGSRFKHEFLIPMGAAIWSCPSNQMLDFPALTFVRFFTNHGLMSFSGQHQWYTVTGGSQEYVKKIIAPIHEIRLNAAITKVAQASNQLSVTTHDGKTDHYDHVVIAAHADEALAMLEHPSADEQAVLSGFTYQKNQAYLHCDTSVMPKQKRCWSSWNYMMDDIQNVSVTYWMNLLQNIDEHYPLFVTLNPIAPIDKTKIFDSHVFTHPVFTKDAIAAQAKIPAIQGKRNIWFCGAYQRYGFHEDGLQSAVKVAQQLGVVIPWH